MIETISVRGARQHNLKNINFDIPRNRLTVVTGLSGSGKSSLAFDILYAEGQRRYVETLSPYARQFLDQMERPEVDSIEGLSPAIAIEQKTTNRNPRSTVGTITEIYDYLRLLYSSIGLPHCPRCGKEVSRQSTQQIVQNILSLGRESGSEDGGLRVMVLAPVVRGRKGEFRKLFEKFSKEGFLRARVDGTLRQLDEDIQLSRRSNHTIEVVVDRLLLRGDVERRLTASLEVAMKLAKGLVQLAVVGGEEYLYSQVGACVGCGLSLPTLEPRSFSFNSPYGACGECRGLGNKYEFDPAKVIVDWARPLFDGGLGPGSGSKVLPPEPAAHGPNLRLRFGNPLPAVSTEDTEPDPLRSRRPYTIAQTHLPRDHSPATTLARGDSFGKIHGVDGAVHVGGALPAVPRPTSPS